jgi:hypothetical protein
VEATVVEVSSGIEASRMKLMAETRFDVSDEDAKEHGVPDAERFGLMLVFACTPEERVKLKEFAEMVGGNSECMDDNPTHIVMAIKDLEEQKRQLEQARKDVNAAYASANGPGFFDIPGIRFRKYNMERVLANSGVRGITARHRSETR